MTSPRIIFAAMFTPPDLERARVTLLKEALAWYQAGYTPLPVKPDGSKAPAVKAWTQLQHHRPTLSEIIDLFNVDHDGLGLICGATSGNLEMLELEGRAVDEFGKLSEAFANHDLTHLWGRITNGYSERTPSGGVHWYYRISGAVTGNTKLARRPASPDELAANPGAKVQVLIETRGEGGFTVVAPSAGRTHPTGKRWERGIGSIDSIPTITENERDAVHAMATLLDQMPAVDLAATNGSSPASLLTLAGGLRPGDDYNLRASWKDILEPHGWKMVRHFGGTTYGWQRPGKRHPGLSATTGRNDADNLYIFSTATEHEEEKPHSKFSMYAQLEHGGDYKAAARALRAQGYGDQTPSRHLHAVSDHPTNGTAALEPEPELGEDFWDQRPVLTHLREFAYSRMCSPHAVLGVVLLRALHTVPPAVVLPAVIGGHGSLNLFVALVGSSGTGKGAAEAAAADAIGGLGEIYSATTGSGEGIAHQYAHREKGEIVNDRDAVLFTVPEVDTLTAIGSRQGSTLLSQLRSAFSGERLGYSYADASRRIPILRHSYRLAMVVGVQPEKAGPLLHDADGGTPQRFIWLQATDPKITATPPAEPKPFPVELPSWGKLPWDVSGRRIIDVPDQIIAEIRQAHAARARGEDTALLDGHAVFAREKVAMAFAVLDSRSSITLDDWGLAGTVMRFSDITRAHIESTLHGVELRKRTAQTELLVDRQVQAEDRVWRLKVERVADLLAKRLVDMGGDVGAGALRKRIRSADRDVFDHALNLLVGQGHVVVEGEPNRRVKVVAK